MIRAAVAKKSKSEFDRYVQERSRRAAWNTSRAMATDATLPFVTVDAFTSVRFGGNPAAVVVLPREEPGKRRHAPPPEGIKWEFGKMPASHELSGRDGWPPDLFLQDVAREMNLSETAFVREKLDRRKTVGRGEGEELFVDYDLRWFTPSGTEVDLCGHATLASAHALWDTARVAPFAVIRFHTRSGILPVVPLGEGVAELNFPSAAPNMLLLGTAPEAIRAPHKKASPSVEGSDDENDDETDAASTDDAPHNPACVTPETVAAALGLSNLRADVDGEPTGDVILPNVAGRNSIGDTFAIYPDPAHVLAARPNLKRIAALGGRGLVVTAAGGVATKQGGGVVDFTARFFAPNIGKFLFIYVWAIRLTSCFLIYRHRRGSRHRLCVLRPRAVLVRRTGHRARGRSGGVPGERARWVGEGGCGCRDRG